MNTRFIKPRRALIILSVLASCVLAGTVYYLSRPSPVQRLQPYLGQDLRALSGDEQIKFDGLIGRLAPGARVYARPNPPKTMDPRDWWDYFSAPPRSINFFGHVESWYLWRVANEHDRARLVLFQGQPLWCIPGSSSARIFVFDVEGKLLTESEFETGYRITIEDARWLEDSAHGFPCLLVCSGASINGRDITSQYYAFIEDTFALVRLEDSAGEFAPVYYDHANPCVGPRVPERSVQEWQTALCSENRVEVLRTLVWLGGSHSNPPLRDENLESYENAVRAMQTRDRPGVRSAVEVLTCSEDRWVREAAQHAWAAIQGGNR